MWGDYEQQARLVKEGQCRVGGSLVSLVVSLYLSLGPHPVIIISNWLLFCSLLSPAPRQRGTELSSFWLWELYYATVRQKTQLLLPSNRLNPQLRPWVVWPVSWLFCGELIINHREELQRWYVSSEHGASQITNNLLQGKSKTVIIPSTLCAQF